MLLYLLSMLMLVSQSCGGNKDLSSLLQYVAVAPFTGAWIETDVIAATIANDYSVAPFTGAWIETAVILITSNRVGQSPPSRGRGLKPESARALSWLAAVAPFTGAWIETGERSPVSLSR